MLPPAERKRITPQLAWADLPLGHVVYESGDRPEYVYFPVTSIVSPFYIMEDDSSDEIAIVDNEGMVGIAIFMDGKTTPNRAMVQSAGDAYHLSARTLKQEFTRTGAMQCLLLRYTQALITQVAQATACNRYHSIDQQLRRWPLLSLDRLPSNRPRMTQELIANMLGVCKSGVTGAALKLQTAELIRHSHGTIEVLDRPGLERRVHEYYVVVKREFDRLLPDLEVL